MVRDSYLGFCLRFRFKIQFSNSGFGVWFVLQVCDSGLRFRFGIHV